MVIYNHHIPQKALDHKSPIEAMKAWQKKEPKRFKKQIYKQAGLDTRFVS